MGLFRKSRKDDVMPNGDSRKIAEWLQKNHKNADTSLDRQIREAEEKRRWEGFEHLRKD